MVNVRVNVRPGAITECHALPSAVEVCVMLSLLIHVTEFPTASLRGLGEKAVVVKADAPITIDTEVPGAVGPAGVKGSIGVGDAVGKEVAPPQPDEASIARTANVAGILIVMDAASRRGPFGTRPKPAEFKTAPGGGSASGHETSRPLTTGRSVWRI